MDVIETTAITTANVEPVTPFSADEQRLMYIFVRVPFVPIDLNWLQTDYLPLFLEWGWYERRADGTISPTTHFLDRLSVTQAALMQAEQERATQVRQDLYRS